MYEVIDQKCRLVDNLVEDEFETESLRVKPTCFIILGRPGVGKSTLAKRIAETWNCILIDDTDLLMTHIKNETREGIECADKDLVNRLSGVKQCPKTGRLYTRDQWNPQELFRGKGKNDEEAEDREEQEALLRHMSTLKTVAPGFAWRRSRWGHICPVALKEGRMIPGIPEFSVGFRDKFYIISSQEAYKKFIINPRTYLLPPMPRPPCRVSIIGPPQAGKSTMCKLLAQHYNVVVIDMDALVQPVLASIEKERLDKVKEETTRDAIEKIKMEIESGKLTFLLFSVTENHPEVQDMVLRALEEARQMSTAPDSLYTEVLLQHVEEIEDAESDRDIKPGWVLDNFPRTNSQMQDLQESGILPDCLLCLSDTDENHVLKRLYELNKESIDKAVIKRMLREQTENQTIGFQQEEEDSDLDAERLALLDHCDFGYPDGPEMNDCKLQLQQFVNEWELMQCPPSVAVSELEIGDKSPEVLLQEMIHQMEKPFQYVPWEMSDVDLDQELEDMKALTEQEKGSSEDEEKNEVYWFYLEGFPNNSEELEYMIQQQLFPDLVVVMEVDVSDVQMRLLPLYLSKWQVQHEQREKQRSILRELHKKNREETIAKGELNSGKNIKKSVMRKVLNTQKYTHLVGQMQNYLTQGLVVPDELAIQCLEVVLLSSVCSTRGLHLMHNSAEILHIRCSCYKQEVEHVRRYFRKEYQIWIQVSGLKSKWWIWDCILTEVSISMKYIRSYLERTRKGQAACINRLCITPKELQCHLGEFGLYCPVCLALHHHLFDCSEDEALTHAAEHRGHYYKMCGKNHLERFLLTPDEFVTPGCPHTLKPPDQLPAKLTEIQVKNRFPQQVEMKGSAQYEALVQGKINYAAEYRGKIYFFETEQKRHKFMRTPETYLIPKLPVKVPPVCEPVSLTSLPVLGYLEQGVSEAIIKAMTAVGCLKPKYPFINIQKSALIYVALYLKAFNHNSTTRNREQYRKKLALFEEDCALVPYLGSIMKGDYKPPNERPIDLSSN
ncbi:Adenylate kinase 9 [Takifugu flavidus]|uniref:Adenylate kinase 9 n=1 Tax=Takifugu flavidus TaxID=433684 RepID=A0A5C6NRX5_9TELE|nr:Adenylate kinase 9 [Takifugu flavidus]